MCKDRLKNIKLIVTDLDGTLLNKEKKVTEYSAEILRKAEEEGIKLCIATGRFIEDIKYEMEDIGVNPYYINMNGAEVRDPSGELIKEINIDYKKLDIVLNYFKKYDVIPELYTSDGEYVVGITEEESISELYNRLKFLFPDREITKEEVVNNQRFFKRKMVKDIQELIDKGVRVRKVAGFSENIEDIKEAKKIFNSLDGLVCVSALVNNFEVTNIEAQKGPALKSLIDSLGLSEDEIVIFGDGENDISMFNMFENAVAMGNAMDIISDIANYHCMTNYEDGVANFIKDRIL